MTVRIRATRFQGGLLRGSSCLILWYLLILNRLHPERASSVSFDCHRSYDDDGMAAIPSEPPGHGSPLTSSIDDSIGQLLGRSPRRFEFSRSPEVIKMESMRHIRASLLDRALACLLQLTMV